MPVSAKRNYKKRTHQKRPPEQKQCLLRAKAYGKRWSFGKKLGLWSWNFLLLATALLVLGVCCLWLSYSNYPSDVFKGYFEKPMIVFMNLLIPAVICFFLYATTGRSWIAYLVTALLCLSVAIGNYYLIMMRTDPLQWQDISCLREALNITGTQHYHFEITWRVVLSVLLPLGCTVCLFFFGRFVPKKWSRLVLIVLAILALFCGYKGVLNSDIYSIHTRNYDHINTWSTTQIYCSRGVLYSFTRDALLSIGSNEPDGYSEKNAENQLKAFADADIPEDQKINIISIMRESYSDLSDLESTDGTIDWSCYDLYHALADESYTGRLITNGFGGNTKDAERGFLTGSSYLVNYRKPANSYVWYLRRQGYLTEGAHPFNGWFYNRQNIDKYLGFENYEFREDTFDALVGTEKIAEDDVLFDEIWRMFDQSDASKPYFSFSVTYEGHGPYAYSYQKYPTNYILTDADDQKTPEAISMNNYLGCIHKRDTELMVLVDRLRNSDRPVVLVLYGDHNATLGSDINNYTTAAYTHFGIDMSVNSEQGFINYYGTEYLIWANDAAKEVLRHDIRGEGPMISPCYLMNVLFDVLGWDGPAYMQAMDDYRETFPVVSTYGRISVDGALVQNIPADRVKQYNDFRYLEYYWKTNFRYADVK